MDMAPFRAMILLTLTYDMQLLWHHLSNHDMKGESNFPQDSPPDLKNSLHHAWHMK
jgi:hypothetical protein